MPIDVLRLAAFSSHGAGGNPAGVAFCPSLPSAAEMQAVAKAVGYSETVFAAREGDGWRVRYFAPEMEVPFCGHATVALGAALGERHGEGTYRLALNEGAVTVEAARTDRGFSATLVSPRTWTKEAPRDWTDRVLAAFGLDRAQLDDRFPVRIAGAGAAHLVLFLRERRTLAAMRYPFEEVRALMAEQRLVTISLLWRESDTVIHARNAFAAGGVYEDPATGAAAAALAGYLRDLGWPAARPFTILQGEDMGAPSRLLVSFPDGAGEPVRVGGEVRTIPTAEN